MNKADEIRQYAYDHYARPAIQANKAEFTVRAGDVHSGLGFADRIPLVCGALGAKKMCEQYGLKLIRREGPHNGANTYFTFAIVLGLAMSEEPFGDAVYLVSCVKGKREAASKAKDLYISDWFVKARRYVESKRQPWFIISALYGLVDPEEEIEPYDVTLNRMVVKDRRRWAETTLESLLEIDTDSFVFLASNKYREFLEGPLQHAGYRVYVPMRGLRIGEQLSWLKRHTP